MTVIKNRMKQISIIFKINNKEIGLVTLNNKNKMNQFKKFDNKMSNNWIHSKKLGK